MFHRNRLLLEEAACAGVTKSKKVDESLRSEHGRDVDGFGSGFG